MPNEYVAHIPVYSPVNPALLFTNSSCFVVACLPTCLIAYSIAVRGVSSNCVCLFSVHQQLSTRLKSDTHTHTHIYNGFRGIETQQQKTSLKVLFCLFASVFFIIQMKFIRKRE